MPDRETLPVLPLRTAVLFPGPTVPISVQRAGTLRAIEAATAAGAMLFAVAQRDTADEPIAASLHTMGTTAKIVQVQRTLAGVQLLVTGIERASALEYSSQEGYLRALVRPVRSMKPLDEEDAAFEALYKEARERALEFGTERGLPEEVLRNVLASIADAGELSDLVAAYLELPLIDKQTLLESLSMEERLRKVLVHLQRQIELHKAQRHIQSQVQEELGERQREIHLREQLRQIQKELGESGVQREYEELKEKLDRLPLPSQARAEAERELARLESSGLQGMEAQIIRNYLQWLIDLPWGKRSEDNLDLARAQQILDEDHHGLLDVKDRVLEFLAVRQLKARQIEEDALDRRRKPGSNLTNSADDEREAEDKRKKALTVARGPILLFLGPPGVGKTSIAQSVARALGRQYVRVALGGTRDEAEIRGHRRTYVGAMPGRILQGMKKAGTSNPVFLLDEIDKLGVSLQGDPASALLEVLDPAQNNSFTDHYLNVPFDLSEVLFIATANVAHTIPPALLDRMERVEFSGYTGQEKARIAQRYLVVRQLEQSGLDTIDGAPVFSDAAVANIVSHYTRESGVRQLERRIAAVSRKLARRLAAGEAVPMEITPDLIEELLGRPRVHPEQAQEADEVGVATGMYYSSNGGDIMFVEALVRQLRGAATPDIPSRSQQERWGKASLILTGQLGDVMKESARAALTYAITHASELKIPYGQLGTIEAHVHVPAGAVPKDGPSAGVPIAVALASALSGRRVRSDLAMTGEISLRGRVLPIGGVKEKVLGAHRAGIRRILLPEQNRDDLQDIPSEVRSSLEFCFAAVLTEAFALALHPHPEQAAERHARSA